MKNERCIVLNCTNRSHQGQFFGPLCMPCWAFVTQGRGVHNQAFRNACEAVAKAALDHIADDRYQLVKKHEEDT